MTESPKPLPIEESYPIVNCDPTQASAIALARTGKHFIIQGPPGTGKSQTITNLIADFVAQGKRVLFVCEKRAAIDVVYHRLHQSGLHALCCLIHDAQDDKKEFIFDLKTTYEAFESTKPEQTAKTEDQRRRLLDSLKKELTPLERFQSAMRSAPPQAGLPLHQLLQRAIALRGQMPELSALEREQLPAFHHWHESRERIERMVEHLEAIDRDGILAKHPLRRLHVRFGDIDQPLAVIHDALPRIKNLIETLKAPIQLANAPADSWATFEKARQMIEYAASLAFLADHELLAVLTPKSDLAKKLTTHRKKHTAKEQELAQARLAAQGWHRKLSPDETAIALQQIRGQERSFLRFIQPGWWRLRGLLRRSYDFGSHQVRPTYSGVMVDTESYYQIDNVLERDVLRPRLLRNFGWNIVQVLTKDWFENAEGVVKSIANRLAQSE